MRLAIVFISIAFLLSLVVLTALKIYEPGRIVLTIGAAIAIALPFAITIRYRKPKADHALVRTGGRKYRVTITGGMLINTIFHEVREISLNTVRLNVLREGVDALITQDFLRADMEAVFYIRAEPKEEDVLRAAQSLGQKSMTPETIRDLLEPKLEGALRAVAATQQLQDLLQKRQDFADAVQEVCKDDLLQNGLTLETVSIIRVDQTPLTQLNPDNKFDAIGIRTITGITQQQRQEKEQIIRDTEVAIKRISVEALKQQYTLEQDRSYAEADQQKNIATYAAEREADTVKFQYLQQQAMQETEFQTKLNIEKAKISQEQGVREREIEKTLNVERARISQEQTIREREIEMNLRVEMAQIDQTRQVQQAEIERTLMIETSRIEQERRVKETDIARTLAIETARISQEQTVQEREIQRNLIVEKASIDQGRQVQEAEIQRNLSVERVKFFAEVGVKQAEVESKKTQYQLEQDRAYAEYDQQKAIAVYKAQRQAETAQIEYEQKLIAERARIEQEQRVQEREIERNLRVETAQIAQSQQVQEREIERMLIVEKARISQEQQVKEADIARTLAINLAQIDQERRTREVDIARTLAIEMVRISQEQTVQQREIERVLNVERSRILQEQGIRETDIARTLAIEMARISQEQTVQQREIERVLNVERSRIFQEQQIREADIARTLMVEQARIAQELTVGLLDEDRKIQLQLKQRQTELAQRERLLASAERTGAEVNVTAIQRTREAEWQREVAIIGAERDAKPVERMAQARLVEMQTKAEGEKVHLQARNAAEQRVLVQEAIMSFIQSSPQLIEHLMKPVEKIQSIRILDMGGNGGQGSDRGNMGKLANTLLDTGAVAPMLKELFQFAEVDTQKIAAQLAKYLSDLVKIPRAEAPAPTANVQPQQQ